MPSSLCAMGQDPAYRAESETLDTGQAEALPEELQTQSYALIEP